MISGKIDTLVTALGVLTPEQTVHAAVALRLAAVMDGDDAPLYALPAMARELRNAVSALVGAPAMGQGVTDADLAALLGEHR